MLEKIINIIRYNLFNKSKIILISEPTDWVVKDVCKNIINELNQQNKKNASLNYSVQFLKNKIIHLGVFGLISKINNIDDSNKIILTIFHIVPNDPKVKFLLDNLNKIKLIHTACKKTRNQLIELGIPTEKIILIPLGINLNVFQTTNDQQKIKLKQKLGLPEDKIIIGSFQKDGNGWNEGLEPKLIKGPDIFCDVVEKLAKKHPIHILLTGPARGYVKKRLEQANIPYTHNYLKNYLDIVNYYKALDLYIVASRIEGGPKAILECWATGIPLISTKVGMIPDISQDKENILLSDVEDADQLVNNAEQIINNSNIAQRLIKNGLNKVQNYSWKKIVKQYEKNIYSQYQKK